MKSTGELISGAKALVTATGGKDPQGQAALAFLDQLKGPEMLKGLDLSKPLGGYSSIPANGGEPPYGVIMVPITAQADFLAMLERFGIQVSPKAGVDGVTHQIIAARRGGPVDGPVRGRLRGLHHPAHRTANRRRHEAGYGPGQAFKPALGPGPV